MMTSLLRRVSASLLLLFSGLILSALTALLLFFSLVTTAQAQPLSGTNIDMGYSRQTAAHVIGLTEDNLTRVEARLTELEEELTILESDATTLEQAIERLTPRSCATNQKITWSNAYGCDTDRTL